LPSNHSPFLSPYQEFIYVSRYSRYLDEEKRRETWPETITRYFDFMEKHLATKHGYNLSTDLRNELWNAVYNLEVMPSMRALMTAGEALERDNTCGYNCAYLTVDDPKAFDEAMFILMCGTGVGFSVERQYVNKLPDVPDKLYESETTVVVKDSKEGWAKAYRQILALLYSGEIPKWDTSRLRPAGARLKTFGGRSSGPEPLISLFEFTIGTFRKAQGRKLTSIECHDLMCKIGDIVVSGGVRRSAMISLSNLSDDRMRKAKMGNWWETTGYRALANNSVAYTEKPDVGAFMEEWNALYQSHSGERGIFNREASVRQAGKSGRRDTGFEFGTNPCSEIILRPNQFCNLTEVVIRSTDDYESLARKVRLATVLGTFQSTLTYFPYLRKVWNKNTEEERLLGVSLTGIMDSELTNGKDKDLPLILENLKNVALYTNSELAGQLAIEPSAAITCVKPSGTVSQLVDSASGIHSRHSQYYSRSVRADNSDPVTQLLKDQGVYWESDVTKPDRTTVFFFPMKAPDGAVTRDDLSAIQQLELWKVYQEYWCEHKPSVTINVKDHEWPEVGGWVYNNFDMLSGVSFLPYDGGTYRQAPYQEIDEATYEVALANTPTTINWSTLTDYEVEDTTVGSQTAACGPDGCEIVDLI
jgi:ribonucleoside-triphosphate reductase